MRKLLPLALVVLLLPSCISFSDVEGDLEEDATFTDVDLEQDGAPPPRSRTADVVERVLPSLVNVRVAGLSQTAVGGETRGQGSGVVIDSKGVIVTNNHVVQDAVRVRIFFQDGHDPVDGHVIDTEAEKDLAVIKVPTTGLTPIAIGSSDSLRLGDDVIALGFPLGLGGPTVTKGIVSGKDRSLDIPRDGGQETLGFEGLLQTDAAINPGNSGGPLVDTAGRLVGINTAAAGAASAENVGFAIAIDAALPVIEEILAKPPEQRAWLGVGIDVVDPLVADELGLDEDQEGALITQTVKGAPAEESGLEPGDVIVAIEGEPVETPEDLTRILTDFEPGDTIAVQIVDEDGSDTVELTLEQRPVPSED